MKNTRMITLGSLLVIAMISVAQAETLTSQYGVNISDANPYHDGNNLYQLFNQYFTEQLGENTYTSSNDLFNTYGVDPNTDWTTQNSSIVGAFKVAAMGHEMSVVSRTTGESLGSIYSVGGTVNIGEASGITDLSGPGLALPDGQHVDFHLNATGGGLDYTWSSNPTENGDAQSGWSGTFTGDNMIHMIALDITDLYNQKNGTDFESVYMFGWEDLDGTYAPTADWDYQDFVSIITNLTPASSATPEPATMLMFLVGGGFASVLSYRNRNKRK